MKFSDNAMSVILLCSYIGLKKEDTAKPFSLGEWNRFLDNILEKKLSPSIILNQDKNILNQLNYDYLEIERISRLVSRGGAVAFEIDDLSNKGIEVITMFDADYPVLLKKKLKRKTPPVLFYAGDINLSKKIGIAVVGSRNVNQEGVDFTKKLVAKAAQERLIIYSGGAKGVDSISEQTAIEHGSAVVSFIADSLTAKIKKNDVLYSLLNKQLLLISDVKPDTGFSAGRAMNRNKYIYASAYGAFVVSSDYNKGGTWAGAVENMKHDWTKEYVWNNNEYIGNQKLIEKGAIAYDLSNDKIYDSLTKKENSFNQIDIFTMKTIASAEIMKESNESNEFEAVYAESNHDIYDLVKDFIIENFDNSLSLEEASEKFKVAKGQMKIWLKRLCEDDKITYMNGVYSRNN